jgi:hypothetical protein
MTGRRSLLKLAGLGVTISVLSLLRDVLTVGSHSLAEKRDHATGACRDWNIFPIGVFEDGNVLDGDTHRFEAMVGDLTARGFDSVFFANNADNRDPPLLDITDRLGFNVFYAPTWTLNRDWWPEPVSATIDTARQVITPLVEQIRARSSLRGYLVADEPRLDALQKVTLMTQAFHELDPSRIAMPILTGTDRVGPIFAAAHPDVMLLPIYPVGYDNPIGDFSMTGFGYSSLDFVSYVRAVTDGKPAGIPFWTILQTHSLGNGGRFSLREPVPAEVRAQNWLAIGEGATGFIWFTYSSEQGWTGLHDNPSLLATITALNRRIDPLRSTLLQLHRGPDRFGANGGSRPYVSSLVSRDAATNYVVAVNQDCLQPQTFAISSPTLSGRLCDLETGRSYPLDSPIAFAPGDGKLFEFVEDFGAASAEK